jgi:hypothetical protein
MNNESSPRLIGALVVFLGVLLVGLNWFYVHRNGQFFAIAAIAGPTATGYGVSILIRPPETMPQKNFEQIHKILAGLGFSLGVIYFLLLKFGWSPNR